MSSSTTTTDQGNRTAVVYFSATGTTEGIASSLAEHVGADLHRIEAQVPYSSADLDYRSDSSRATTEQNDSAQRPEITAASASIDLNSYDVVFLGYPIWFGQAPRVLSTFLEGQTIDGSLTVVPFCTSGSSGIGASAQELRDLLPSSVEWLPGERFDGGAGAAAIAAWADGLDLPTTGAPGAGAGGAAAGGFDLGSRTVTLNSGYEMPILGLGTYSLDDQTCETSVAALLEAGGRLIDTAQIYGTEGCVGRAIRASGVPREEVFVITKLYPSQFSDADAAVRLAVDTLGLGYIDMLLLHHPGTNDVEAYHAMERAVGQGTVRSIGLSNWYVEELTEFLPQVSITPALVQNEIHPYYQENDVIPFIQDRGIVVQGWYPLGGRGHTRELLEDPVISGIAESHGVTSAQVILRWNLQKGVVVIPGSGNPDHVRENLDLFGFELSADEMQRIRELDRGEKHDWY